MIPPGAVSTATAAELAAFVALTAENERRRQAILARHVDRFPAALTAIDASYDPPRYSWYEQAFDQYGQRYTRTGGRTGTTTYSPAFGYGDGTVITDFPAPVELTRRVVAVESTGSGSGSSIGPVYEFPLYCACAEGGPGGVAIVPCCPQPVPRTLHATLSSTCTCFNGVSVTLTYNSSTGIWSSGIIAGLHNACAASSNGTGSLDFVAQMQCLNLGGGFGYQWYAELDIFGPTITPPGVWTKSCTGPRQVARGAIPFTSTCADPFNSTFDLVLTHGIVGTACDCEGQTVTMTVTE